MPKKATHTAPILVMGHKNPDNDSICSAVAYAYLLNELAKRDAVDGEEPQVYEPVRLGPLPVESAAVLEANGFPAPRVISSVYSRVGDVMTKNPYSIRYDAPLIEAGRSLRQYNVRALVVTDEHGIYRGLVTTRMIAERYISATDLVQQGYSEMDVASDLIHSLGQKVEDILETNVLRLSKTDLLKEAVVDLMNSDLREAIVLDDNGRAVGIMTRSDVTMAPKRKVILVDHNEPGQAADGIEEVEIVGIIDHHRIADVSTTNPIQFINLPLGSTSTIVTLEFERNEVKIPPALARVLLAAVLTDTVILKSPTTTAVDKRVAAQLAQIGGVDVVEYGMKVFKTRGADDSMPAEQLVGADSKEFSMGDDSILVAQHETVDLASIVEREDEIRAYMKELREKNGYALVLFLVTDIIAEGSQFFAEGNTGLVNRAFGIDCSKPGGVWMPGILSRKKQVIPRLMSA